MSFIYFECNLTLIYPLNISLFLDFQQFYCEVWRCFFLFIPLAVCKCSWVATYFFCQFRNVFSHYLFKLCFFPFLSFVPFWDSNYIWFGPFITVHSCILTFFYVLSTFFFISLCFILGIFFLTYLYSAESKLLINSSIHTLFWFLFLISDTWWNLNLLSSPWK